MPQRALGDKLDALVDVGSGTMARTANGAVMGCSEIKRGNHRKGFVTTCTTLLDALSAPSLLASDCGAVPNQWSRHTWSRSPRSLCPPLFTGNEELLAVTQGLPSLIRKTRCRPHRWENRVKEIVDDGT